jgi:dTDP-glucose pyrophosphorylase
MRTVNVVVPMAGLGARFQESGFLTPKPLLQIKERYFFQIAVGAVIRNIEDYRLTFVVLEDHKRKFNIDETILSCFPSANIVSLVNATSGAAESAYSATKKLEQNPGSLVIADCDQWIDGEGLFEMFDTLGDGGCDVAIPVFNSTDPNYGYVESSEKRQIKRIVEKDQISDLAVAGCYGFRSIKLFNDLYSANAVWGLEQYMTNVVMAGITSRLDVEYFCLDSHIPFGTPIEWEAALVNPKLLGVLDEHF